MKTAYAYLRISKEDQSNYSIEGQERVIKEYAQKNNILIKDIYTDDGYSAKDFNRPAWKKLEAVMAGNKHNVDYLIVHKYDRLIRHAAEGLSFVQKLEERSKITLISVLENFFINPRDPYYFKSRADMFVNAEFERRVIASRTAFGIWSARSAGRHINKAPLGFLNARDSEDKPIMIHDEQKKKVIIEMYNDFISGIPDHIIVKKAKQQGFRMKAHGALHRILLNPLYGGLVRVPEFWDAPEKIVKGIHSAIVPEEMYWKAYYMIKDLKKPRSKSATDNNLPLRGFLMCPCCNKPFTGSKSKGRNDFFWYYRCFCKAGQNYSAPKVEQHTLEILQGLSIDPRIIPIIKEPEGERTRTAVRYYFSNFKSRLILYNE